MINWDRIHELRNEVGDDDLNEVIALFCEEVEEVLDALEVTPAGELPERLHFLKGSAMNIGLDDVSTICRHEENRLKSDPGVLPDFAAIRSAYSQAKNDLIKVTSACGDGV